MSPESVEDIANALERLTFDTDLRTDLIEKGRQRRLAFNWDNTAAILYENIKKAYGKGWKMLKKRQNQR